MWRKNEESAAPPVATPKPRAPKAPAPRREVATLGSSISIVGDLTGEEDLVIEGRIEGEIRLKKNKITIGKNGRVKADIYGHDIHVEGDVKGNLYGEDEIVIRQSGRVQGNLTAPRVTLENGSKFKGSIDMEPRVAKTAPVKAQKVETTAAPTKSKADTDLDPETLTQPSPAPGLGA